MHVLPGMATPMALGAAFGTAATIIPYTDILTSGRAVVSPRDSGRYADAYHRRVWLAGDAAARHLRGGGTPHAGRTWGSLPSPRRCRGGTGAGRTWNDAAWSGQRWTGRT